MKNVIFCLIFLLISSCTLLNPPEIERPVALDSRDIDALIAVATIFNEDKDTHASGGKSLIDWGKVKLKGDEITRYDIANLITGNEEIPFPQKASLGLYSMYYLIKLSNLYSGCTGEASCVLRLLKSGASKMREKRNQDFLESYKADNKKFKSIYYDPEKIIPVMNNLVTGLMEMKNQEIEENSKLPDTQPIEFSYSNDEYVNAAIALLNNAKLEEYNIRDRDGNKTEKYGNPTIYGRPLFFYPYMYKNTVIKQAKSCEKVSAYTRVDIDNACKRAIIAGVKDWVETARDPNISKLAWKITASQSILRDEIMFSHWAGMARVHQKSLNETGRLSL
ncbi:hypothetical protein BDD26_3428 [Xenorhabdus cabanillasii]|uniref:Lipoprotein n=1 Tax=Xenorhabdus cabanillasii TaxID=351673 RepID=A0A3D9UGB5_9GAMM|nr:hypothetical protein [Xenorhabdus cabanillasii]REF28508.1 hypothetical protein BDD26_3428 [Xenorhabdus cabanillasii]